MPNQISNWSITNVEKICREYIKVGFQQQDFKKKNTSSQIFLAHGALQAFFCRMKIS